jgi:PAS domain S-box-containing protein
MEPATAHEFLAELSTLKRREREQAALLLAYRAVTSSLESEESLRAIVQHAATISPGASVWLSVLDPDAQALRGRVATHMAADDVGSLQFAVGQGFSGTVAAIRMPVCVADMRGHPDVLRPDLAARYGLVSFLGVPVLLGEQLLGVLSLSFPEPHASTEEEIGLLSAFAAQAAIALENARLYETVRRELAERTRVEAALRESEERYRRISVAVTDYIYTVRLEAGRVIGTQHGPGCVAVTGYGSEDFAADPDLWIRMVDEADRDAVREQARRIVAGEDPPPLEHRIRRKDGARRWVRNTTVPHRDARGVLRSYDGLIQDVTERALVEQALRARTQQLDTIRAISQEITGELDLPALLDLIVRRASELVGAEAGSILLWDEAAELLVPSAWHRFGEWQREFCVRLGVGLVGRVGQQRAGMVVNNYRDWSHALPTTLAQSGITAALAEPLLCQDRLLGVIALVHERAGGTFTDQDRETLSLFAAQAAIAIENARLYAAAVRRGSELEALVSAARSMTSGLDLQEILDRIVAEAARISGAPHVKVLLLDRAAGVLRVGALKGSAMSPDSVLPLGVGSSGIVAKTGELLFMEDAQNDPRSVFADQDRALGIVTYLGLPIIRAGQVLGVLTFNSTAPRRYTPDELTYLAAFADHAAITIEKAQLFQELNQSYANLQTAQDELIRAEKLRALGQMSAGIAHDLNNMLAAILGQVELLRMRTRDAEIQDGLRLLEIAATDGAHVVRRLQDFARQRGRSPLTPVDLAEVVTEVLKITRPRWKDELQRQGRVIDTQVRLADLPPILGYAPEIREVLTNLILNAVDAMPAGGSLRLTGRVVEATESPAQPSLPGVGVPSDVELLVTDTGVGMSDEIRQRAFDPFFTTKGVRGTGLGLSLVYGIMERHGGRIDVQSAPNQGTTVVLRFRGATKGEPAAPGANVVEASSPRRMLVVDDDAMVRQTIASLLRASGHAVTEAEGGAAAIALLDSDAFDLVLTDLGMPEVTGWDVARAVRARRPGLPIVLLTGWGEHGTGEPTLTGLVSRILGKPVRLEDLLAVVDQLTAPRAAGEPAGRAAKPRS